MPSKLCVWGNSLGVRLPRHVAEVTGVRAGDFAYVRVADSGAIEITPVKPRDMPALKIKKAPTKTPGKNKLEDW